MPEADPVATAACAAAWAVILDEPWAWAGELIERVRDARDATYQSLAQWLAEDGFHSTSHSSRPAPVTFREGGDPATNQVRGRALVWAWVLMLLGGDEAFRQVVPVNDLAAWLDAHRDLLDTEGRMVLDLALAGRKSAGSWGDSPLVAA